jgi:hypothetical protein
MLVSESSLHTKSSLQLLVSYNEVRNNDSLQYDSLYGANTLNILLNPFNSIQLQFLNLLVSFIWNIIFHKKHRTQQNL